MLCIIKSKDSILKFIHLNSQRKKNIGKSDLIYLACKVRLIQMSFSDVKNLKQKKLK